METDKQTNKAYAGLVMPAAAVAAATDLRLLLSTKLLEFPHLALMPRCCSKVASKLLLRCS